ncbi:MAG: succinylglutamate desuccinylase/aspartoacylase family protein [Candidatus Heimdallarchaeaceae archaeon]
MEFGNIVAKKGEKVFGFIPILDYPHGGKEQLPVCIIQGEKEDRPIFLLTANIHGNELEGIAVLQDLIQEIEPAQLIGTLIIIPVLNPAGLLTLNRTPFYQPEDPNRLWNDPKPKKAPELIYEDPYDSWLDPTNYPRIQEQIWKKLAQEFQKADYFIDLHCHAIRSMPFIYVDRVFYDDTPPHTREKAKELFNQTLEMAKAFGLTIVLENPPRHYVRLNLHRSTTGSFLNSYYKPAFTVELGSSEIVDSSIRTAAKKGLYNVLAYVGMLDIEQEPITEVTVHTETLWREIPLRATTTGFFVPHAEHGAFINRGKTIAEIRDVFGKVKDCICATEEGVVLAYWNDIKCYPNSSIGTFLVKNTLDTVFPWDFTKKEKNSEK